MGLNVVMAPSVAPIGSKLTITENGQFDVTDYAVADVNVSGGGGETWNTVFEGNVTTEADDQGGNFAILDGISSLSADTIKVTFNGIEYTLNAYTPEGAPEGVIAYGDLNEEFLITSFNGQVILMVPTAGTYTLKIEEPQSGGGSSDLSTAEVTLVCNNSEVGEGGLYVATADNIDNASRTGMIVEYGTPITRTVILYKGKAIAMTEFVNVACEGNATYDSENHIIYITGDCTITIS